MTTATAPAPTRRSPLTSRSKNAWGFGPAPLVKPATTATSELVVFLSDLHVPHQDTEAVAAALRLLRKLKPDRVVLNGDVNDFFQLSRFNTAQERLDLLQQEIDEGNVIRRAIRKAVPNAVIDETEGNHDNRIKSYVAANARALSTLRALEPENLFLYRELGITWHPGAGFRLRPEFLVKHGTIVRAEAGATAKAELAAAGISGISGHTHRLVTFRRSGYVARQWTESGCLCRTDPEYVIGPPNWQQGLVVGEFSTKTTTYVTHEVPLVNGKLRFGGTSC